MLDDVRFVMAAVAKKAYVQELTHVRIKDGRITGYNGVMALSSPIQVDLDVRPNAAKLLAAIRACEGTISLHVTAGGKLSVRAGKFKVLVESLPDDGAYTSEPEGVEVALGPNFLRGIKLLSPAMGVDASRPWAMGIKVHGETMYATNNVIVAQFWHGATFPHDVVIPSTAVDELLRIGTPPTKVQVCEHAVTFWFGEDRWLKTNLLDGTAWPLGRLDGALDAATGAQVPFPDGFFDAVATLKPFLDEDPAIYIRPDSISTSREVETAGASVDVVLPTAPELMAYSFKQLEVLGQVATAIDWANYPRPCMFTHQGEPLRGLVVGRML